MSDNPQESSQNSNGHNSSSSNVSNDRNNIPPPAYSDGTTKHTTPMPGEFKLASKEKMNVPSINRSTTQNPSSLNRQDESPIPAPDDQPIALPKPVPSLHNSTSSVSATPLEPTGNNNGGKRLRESFDLAVFPPSKKLFSTAESNSNNCSEKKPPNSGVDIVQKYQGPPVHPPKNNPIVSTNDAASRGSSSLQNNQHSVPTKPQPPSANKLLDHAKIQLNGVHGGNGLVEPAKPAIANGSYVLNPPSLDPSSIMSARHTKEPPYQRLLQTPTPVRSVAYQASSVAQQSIFRIGEVVWVSVSIVLSETRSLISVPVSSSAQQAKTVDLKRIGHGFVYWPAVIYELVDTRSRPAFQVCTTPLIVYTTGPNVRPIIETSSVLDFPQGSAVYGVELVGTGARLYLPESDMIPYYSIKIPRDWRLDRAESAALNRATPDKGVSFFFASYAEICDLAGEVWFSSKPSQVIYKHRLTVIDAHTGQLRLDKERDICTYSHVHVGAEVYIPGDVIRLSFKRESHNGLLKIQRIVYSPLTAEVFFEGVLCWKARTVETSSHDLQGSNEYGFLAYSRNDDGTGSNTSNSTTTTTAAAAASDGRVYGRKYKMELMYPVEPTLVSFPVFQVIGRYYFYKPFKEWGDKFLFNRNIFTLNNLVREGQIVF